MKTQVGRPLLGHAWRFPTQERFNLVLVGHPRVTVDFKDFYWIRDYIHRTHSDIRVTVLNDRSRYALWNYLRAGICIRPTMVFAPKRPKSFRPLRGTHYHGTRLLKSEEYRRLEAHGLPVADWGLLSEHSMPDMTGWGDFVVVKPDLGACGAEVKAKRVGRVRWKPSRSILSVIGHSPNQVVQRYVHTGAWPASYRVTTLFGRALWSWKVQASSDRRALSGPESLSQGGVSIVSSSRGCTYEINNDPDIISIAERVYEAFPEHPLLGVDVLREEPSGKLYIGEINPAGAWHFRSPTGIGVQRQFRLNLEERALVKAADILAEETRRHAS